MSDNPILLPASRPNSIHEGISAVPAYTLITWTLGRGSVVSVLGTWWSFDRNRDRLEQIWRIWPAVLLHTLFAAGSSNFQVWLVVQLKTLFFLVVVYLSMGGIFNLEIPSVMLTVLGKSFIPMTLTSSHRS